MISRIAAACALFSCILFTASATSEPGDRYLNMKARVLDVVFPLDVAPKPYLLKMILRFGDSDTQLVAVEYQDKDKYWIRRCEITSYSLADIGKGQLSDLISKMVAESPNVQAQEIASKLRTNVSHSFVAPEALNHALDELKAVMISPILADRVAVDQYSEYEYWYDNWQESVHYTITSPLGNAPQDKLGQWMLRFRANLPNLLKASTPQP
jgi:hypothetical protein